jgi:hypothetical protein
MKNDPMAAQALQLLHRTVMLPGFAQGLTLPICHLVATDHDGIGMASGDCQCFGHGQPCGGILGRFAGMGGFIHMWRRRFKWQAQAFQQGFSVDRG